MHISPGLGPYTNVIHMHTHKHMHTNTHTHTYTDSNIATGSGSSRHLVWHHTRGSLFEAAQKIKGRIYLVLIHLVCRRFEILCSHRLVYGRQHRPERFVWALHDVICIYIYAYMFLCLHVCMHYAMDGWQNTFSKHCDLQNNWLSFPPFQRFSRSKTVQKTVTVNNFASRDMWTSDASYGILWLWELSTLFERAAVCLCTYMHACICLILIFARMLMYAHTNRFQKLQHQSLQG